MKSITIENDVLRLVTVPAMGGKIISFYRKDKEFELAAAPCRRHGGKLREDMDFGKYAFGMDDAFPTIDEESVLWKGREYFYPDHGEIWKAGFTVSKQEPCAVNMHWESPEFYYRYEKRLLLEEDVLNIQYRIINTGGDEFPCIWTWHGLMRYEEDLEILLPEEISHYRNVLQRSCLGKGGESYPLQNSVYDFAKVPGRDTNSMVKYYGEEMVTKGCCGVRYPSQNVTCILRYDAQALPFFGVWVTAGGLCGDYNLALEPSSGFYDGINRARKFGKLPILTPGGEMEFWISLMLI